MYVREDEYYDNYFYEGDPRRCPRHGTPTSSPDGLFDAPCGKCEYEMEREFFEEMAEEEGRKPEEYVEEENKVVDPGYIPF